MTFDETYWQTRYENNETSWDAGAITTPLKNYFDQLTNRNLRILIPGAGNAYEAEYLWKYGFKNVTVVDIARAPLEHLSSRIPDFPKNQLIHQDFFDHKGSYDLVVEQTFFCALDPSMRGMWAKQVHQLLVPKGKVVGVLFDCEFDGGPPFGGNRQEYKSIISPLFKLKVFESCSNSISPRAGRELFMILEK